MHVDRCYAFCGFFVFICAELSTSFLISPSLASAKSNLLFSITNEKFSLNACSFLGLYFRRNKIRQRISNQTADIVR